MSTIAWIDPALFSDPNRKESMLLKIGELARRTGLTVRALHHYDDIGLLHPSGRSDAGYRLYKAADIERLHTIQALRHLGLSLDEIQKALTEHGKSLPNVIARQLEALDQDIEKALQLRSQLLLIQKRVASGVPPESGDWLTSLSLMATHSQYFSATELRMLFENWRRDEALWPPLITEMQKAIQDGSPPDSTVAQRLVLRWMEISLKWMDGNIDLLQRWDAMLQQEPITVAKSLIDRTVLEYFHAAMQCRKTALLKFLSSEEYAQLRLVGERDWQVLNDAVEALARDDVPFEDVRARELVQRWRDLLDYTSNDDPAIKAKLLTAVKSEPVLQAGLALSEISRLYLRSASAELTSK
ncbi:MAG: MerR family transcriptional regulator [Pseudomonadota bacterium]|nr:MerR family transcriptional regulator [Pseudomonadota bacterium]